MNCDSGIAGGSEVVVTWKRRMIERMWRTYTRDERNEMIIELRCGEVLEECDFVRVTPYGHDNALREVKVWRWSDIVWKDVHDRFVSDNVCGLGMCYVADHFRRYFNKKKIVTNVGNQSVLNPCRGGSDKSMISKKLAKTSDDKESHVRVDPAGSDEPV